MISDLKFKNKSLKFGFTLIELLVVISIIGLLATLIAANLNSARSRARDAQRKSDIKNIATALRLYYNDWGTNPAAGACSNGVPGFCIYGCNSGAAQSTAPTGLCDWGSAWSNGPVGGSGSTTYMSKLPKDPLSSQGYYYTKSADGSYTLTACAENTSDPNGVSVAAARCAGKWGFVIQQ